MILKDISECLRRRISQLEFQKEKKEDLRLTIDTEVQNYQMNC